MKQLWQDFTNELAIYWLYIKQTWKDFIGPPDYGV